MSLTLDSKAKRAAQFLYERRQHVASSTRPARHPRPVLSARAIARREGISHSAISQTLRRLQRGDPQIPRGRPPALSDAEDAALVAYIRSIDKTPAGPSREVIINAANRLRARRNPPSGPLSNNGKHWYPAWKRAHDELLPSALRPREFSREALELRMQELDAFLDRYDAAVKGDAAATATATATPAQLGAGSGARTASTATAHRSPDQAAAAAAAAAAAVASWPKWPSEDDNIFTVPDDGSSTISLPESRARRLMEHRLMQNWYHTFGTPFQINPGEEWRKLWREQIPDLALRHDNVLCGLLALSAMSLIHASPADHEDLQDARQSYFTLALSAQRHEVAQLSVDNAEPVSFGALLISIASFAMLQERSLEPYQPPMEWLQLGRGAGTVIWQSARTVVAQAREADHPALMTISFSYPYFGKDQSYFAPEMRRDLEGILTPHLPSEDDLADDETRCAYEKTLSYVGSIQRGLHNGEPVYAVVRRIQTFAMLVPPKFVEFLGEQRPRALVTLAHFWATVAQVRTVWWLGGDGAAGREATATREIRAIKRALPAEWMTTMVWPLDQVGLRDLD